MYDSFEAMEQELIDERVAGNVIADAETLEWLLAHGYEYDDIEVKVAIASRDIELTATV